LALAVGELGDLIRSYNPSLVFLCETKQKKYMEKLQGSMGFRNGVCVEGKGKSGGMALWWRDGIDVSIQPWCQYNIDEKLHMRILPGGSLESTGNLEPSFMGKLGRY
jgi:hypothetical protein